jgi:hypothetical protein
VGCGGRRAAAIFPAGNFVFGQTGAETQNARVMGMQHLQHCTSQIFWRYSFSTFGTIKQSACKIENKRKTELKNINC